MTTTHERIAALEAELAHIKASLATPQPPALSPLDAMLQAFDGEWGGEPIGLVRHRGDVIIGTHGPCDRDGHAPAMVRAIAAIPAMIAALRAVNADYFAHVGDGECLPSAASTAWAMIRAALTAAGDTP